VFSLKRKGDFRLQLTRTLRQPGRHKIELYLFTPHESNLSAWTLSEEQFFFTTLTHSFGLLGMPSKDRISKADQSFVLLSPHYEIMYGSWFFQYQASMERLRQQMLTSGAVAEPIARALRLSQNFAQRLRKSNPKQSNQQRYFRQMDIYFSWHAEQFLLESMTLEGYAAIDEELKQSVAEFLRQERRYRKEREYLSDFHGTPTRIWNRMALYHRLLEYPVMLRSKVTELGAGTHKLVKAMSTMLIMSFFTYFLFNARGASEKPLAHPSAGDRAGLCRSRSAARRHDHGHHPQTAQRQAALEDSLADALHPQGTRAATGLARLSQAARSATVSSRTLGQVGDQRGAANHLLSRADDPGQGSTGERRDSGATHAGLRTALRNDPGEPQQAVRPD